MRERAKIGFGWHVQCTRIPARLRHDRREDRHNRCIVIVLNNFTHFMNWEVINFLLRFSNNSLEQLTSDKNRPQFHRNIITFIFYDFAVIWIKSC